MSAPARSTDGSPRTRGPVPRVVIVVGALWTLIALAVSIAVFDGPGRRGHLSPDEAAMAGGIALVEETGTLRTEPPWDHPWARPRQWVTTGDGRITPAYPAAPMLLYGTMARLPGGGWLLFLIPAAGLGAAAAAAAWTLPRWRALGALLPLLAAPATYWWLRPFHNTSHMLGWGGLVALVLVAGVRRDERWLWWAALPTALVAASMRPDQVHLWLSATLVTGLLALPPSRRWRWIGAHVLVGAAWLAVALLGNVASTGDPLSSPAYLVQFPDEFRSVAGRLPTPLREIATIVARQGLPAPSALADTLVTYGLWQPAVPAFVAGFVGLAALLMSPRLRRWRWLVVLLALHVGLFAATRISPTDFGSETLGAGLNHSYPRYVAVAFVLAAGVGLWAVASLVDRRSRTLATGLAVLGAVVATAPLLAADGDETLVAIERQLDIEDAYAAAVDAAATDDAVLLAWRIDKVLGAVRPVGLVQQELAPAGEPRVDIAETARSVRAALRAGLTPHVVEIDEQMAQDLARELGPGYEVERLPLPPTDHLGLYRVTRVGDDPAATAP